MEKYLHKLQPQIGERKQFVNVVLPLAQPNRRTNSKEEAVEQVEINVVVKRFAAPVAKNIGLLLKEYRSCQGMSMVLRTAARCCR